MPTTSEEEAEDDDEGVGTGADDPHAAAPRIIPVTAMANSAGWIRDDFGGKRMLDPPRRSHHWQSSGREDRSQSLRGNTHTANGASSCSPSTPSTMPRLRISPAYRMPMRSITARERTL